jgi:hypothetical protein
VTNEVKALLDGMSPISALSAVLAFERNIMLHGINPDRSCTFAV